ncbi:hypothetical protein [Micromonospora sp. NPDC005203]|uniref:hypothetical protein n=1 Tax=Micromonospora sp. NPDC005203 TaxID=3364226 RepID=UPI00367D1C0C
MRNRAYELMAKLGVRKVRLHDARRAPIQERMLLTLRASRPLQVPPELRTLLRYGRGPDPVPPLPRPSTPDEVGWGVPMGLNALNSADGVLVASPTGSTAYSFAADGPVLSPRLNALVFTPVAPDTAFNRSMVTAPDEPVGVQVLPKSGRVAVVVDGRVHGILDPGWLMLPPPAPTPVASRRCWSTGRTYRSPRSSDTCTCRRRGPVSLSPRSPPVAGHPVCGRVWR